MIRPAPGVDIELQPETALLRMVAWAEARGEPRRGLLGVLHVIRNRALRRDTTLKAEILRPWQFSSFNADDPNRPKMMTAAADDPLSWAAIDAICELFELGYTNDPSQGASHYYVEKMKNPPEWGRGHADWKETVVLGRHVFGVTA